jgi:hypothetical protein
MQAFIYYQPFNGMVNVARFHTSLEPIEIQTSRVKAKQKSGLS